MEGVTLPGYMKDMSIGPTREQVAEPCVEQCRGCERDNTGEPDGDIQDYTCRWYLYPAAKWRAGNCPGATHLKKAVAPPQEKQRVGQSKHTYT